MIDTILAQTEALLGVFVGLGLLSYIIASWAIMVIAQKTNTSPAWLAWIPLANLYLLSKIAKKPLWSAIVAILGVFVPFGQIATGGITMWWISHIAERRGKPGWWGILMIIPVVNLVILTLIAVAD